MTIEHAIFRILKIISAEIVFVRKRLRQVYFARYSLIAPLKRIPATFAVVGVLENIRTAYIKRLSDKRKNIVYSVGDIFARIQQIKYTRHNIQRIIGVCRRSYSVFSNRFFNPERTVAHWRVKHGITVLAAVFRLVKRTVCLSEKLAIVVVIGSCSRYSDATFNPAFYRHGQTAYFF